MLIDDEGALRDWLVATLEPLCDAEPNALARYVLALVTKDKPLDRLRENCIDRLDVFLDRATKDFVDQLFDVIRNRRYIPEAKKENVQPKGNESSDEKSGEALEVSGELQTSLSPSKQEEEETVENPSNSTATSSSEQTTTTVHQQSSGALIQPVKRRYSYRSSSGRHHSPNPRRHVNSSTGGASRHQVPSHYRPSTASNSINQRSHRSSSRSRSGSPPPAKRSQRSYSHSSSGSSSRSSPSRPSNPIHPPSTTNTNFLYKKFPCSDFFENKGYCALGDACPYDHGTNAVVFDQQQQQQPQQQQQQQQPPRQAYYPPYPQYGMPPAHLHPHYHEYNPENPDLKHGPHQGPPMYLRHPPMHHHHPRMHGPPLSAVQGGPPPGSQPPMMMNPQRTLVTVVTNAEPLPLEPRMRPNDSMGGMPGGPNPSMMHNKRHLNSGPYPNDRRGQHHEQGSNNDSNSNNNAPITSNNNNNNNSHHHHHHQHPNNGFNNRGWKRPWQKPDGTNSPPATLEIRKIPVEFNTISKLNEHFSKFGTVTNVQIAYDGSPDSALVAYATTHEAETAYKNPEPLFNNRFIKIFWHNSNKGPNSGTNNNNNNGNSNQSASATGTSSTAPDSSSTKKPLSNVPNPKKLYWMKTQQQSTNKPELSATTSQATATPPDSTAPPAAPVPAAVVKKAPAVPAAISKKDAAKKAAMEIHRKKQGLLEEQIQQQKLLLKKLEAADNASEKESIKALMKQVDATIVRLKDSLRLTPPVKSSTPAPTSNASKATPAPKLSQQDALKQRAQTLQKQIDSLRAKTSADMRRAMTNSLGQSSLNLSSILQETSADTSRVEQQFLVKNVKDLPRTELDEFLQKSGAKQIQSTASDNALLITIHSQSDIDQIQKNGLKFHDRTLDISLQDESSLNLSGKKRTLSETAEDELLGGTSHERTEHDNNDDSGEPSAKRRNQSQTSESDESPENDDEDQLLADNERKLSSIGTRLNESNPTDEYPSNDLDDDDELQLLDS